MHKINIEYFDLKRILNSGQVFRFYETEPGSFTVYSGNRMLELHQQGNEVTFMCNKAEYDEYWESYFDLKRDYGKVIKLAAQNCKDTDDKGKLFLKEAAAYSLIPSIVCSQFWIPS